MKKIIMENRPYLLVFIKLVDPPKKEKKVCSDQAMSLLRILILSFSIALLIVFSIFVVFKVKSVQGNHEDKARAYYVTKRR